MKNTNRDHLVALPEADRGLGVIVPRQLSGLMRLSSRDIAGPVVGAGGALLGIFLARRYGNRLVKSGALAQTYPEVGGAVVGSLLSIPLFYWSRDPKVVASGIVAAVVTSAAVFGARKVFMKTELEAATALVAEDVTKGFGMLTASRAARGLVAQRAVGALPSARVREGTALPSVVRMSMDHTAYGKVI